MRWNDSRGFGFIRPESDGYDRRDDVFCHRSAIQGGTKLREGEQVTSTLEWDERRGKHRAAQVNGAAVVQEDSGGGGGGGGYGRRGGGGYGGRY